MLHIKVRHDLLRQCVDHPGNKHLDQSSPDGFVYWIISPVIFTTSSTSRFCFPSPIRWYGSLLIIFKDNSLFLNQFLNLKKNNIRSNNFQLIMCCFCFIWEFLDRFYVFFFFALICYYIIFSTPCVTFISLSLFAMIDLVLIHYKQPVAVMQRPLNLKQMYCLITRWLVSFIFIWWTS